jgi:hypothetical protein
MGRIDEAIACFNLRKKGASFLYREVAREFKVDRSTLLQCHQRKTLSNAEEAQQRSHLTSQQDLLLKWQNEHKDKHTDPQAATIILLRA